MNLDFHTAKALLEWQSELGADEAIGDEPINRYEEVALAPIMSATAGAPIQVPMLEAEQGPDPVVAAGQVAAAAGDLAGLRAALEQFDLCELRQGARNLVFCDGLPKAKVMIIGEAPGREEDQQGKPFVGSAGQLLDRMLDAIGLSRSSMDPKTAVYVTNILPWRPPQDRDPSADEIAMMLPFIERHIALAAPEFVVLMGNIPCQAFLGRKGIARLRGQWVEVAGRPALPMFHPTQLLRNPILKREAWADLLALKARIGVPAVGR
ncbi:MAG: uracil-DNA glycosylase family 4 [Paracoccaceae bacterium]|jgi:DNA polymerase